MANAQTLLTIAGLGVGGYILYNWVTKGSCFFTTQGCGCPGSPFCQPSAGGATPGTTPTMTQQQQPTTISTAPPTTPPPPAVSMVKLPPPGYSTPLVPSSAAGLLGSQLEQMLGLSSGGTASADQWNYAYSHLTGKGIEQAYSLSSFDSVYGPVVNGVRSSGQMTVLAFLTKAIAAGISPGTSGLGLLTRQPGGNPFSTVGNMGYQRHHPWPYIRSFNLRGVGVY